jgi:hypothetical protein
MPLSVSCGLFVFVAFFAWGLWRHRRQHQLFRQILLITPKADPVSGIRPSNSFNFYIRKYMNATYRRNMLRWETSGALLWENFAFWKPEKFSWENMMRKSTELIDAPEGSEFYQFVLDKMRQPPPGIISRVSMVITSRDRDFCEHIKRESQSIQKRPPRLKPEPPTSTSKTPPPASVVRDFKAGSDFFESKCEETVPGVCNDVKVLFAWHGSDFTAIDAICRDGARGFRTTDGGFFGAGTYCAIECAYASRYSEFNGKEPNSDGEYAVILFACFLGPFPYVITLGADYVAARVKYPGFSSFYGLADEAKSLMPLYDSHFVPVKHYGCFHPVTGQPLGNDVDFQACPEGDSTGHELILHDHTQLLPVAVLWYKKPTVSAPPS